MKKTLCIPMTKNEKTLGWLFLVIQLLFLPTLLVMINGILGSPLGVTGLNLLLFAINFLLAICIFHKFLWSSGKVALKAPLRCLGFALAGLGCYYFLNFLLSCMILAFFPDFKNVNDGNIMSMAKNNFFLMNLGVVVLAPLTEEVLYRGLVFGSLHRRNRWLGYILSVLFFSVIHIIGYIGTADLQTLLIGFLQYIPAGVCLAWAYEQADSIWASIGMHMIINQISMLILR